MHDVDNIIEFDSVGFRYADTGKKGARQEGAILRGFDLQFRAGEFCALLGPSGCGKTTILSLSAGLLKTGAGVVRYKGQQVSRVNTDLSYMTQMDTLLPWRSTAKNIGLPLEIRGESREAIRERVEREVESLGLDAQALAKYPAELSGGMRRRALLARSLITQPAVLLMDEPFAAVDAQLRARLHAELRANVEARGQTVIFVTHDVTESLLLADRVVTLGGRPLTIVDDFEVPFPKKGRDLSASRVDPAFLEGEKRLWAALERARVPATAGV